MIKFSCKKFRQTDENYDGNMTEIFSVMGSISRISTEDAEVLHLDDFSIIILLDY